MAGPPVPVKGRLLRPGVLLSQHIAYYRTMNTPLVAPRKDTNQGSLAVVGMGMTLGSHLTPLARSHIEQADVIFAGLSDNIVEQWLERMHPDVRSLQPYYQEGKSRRKTYEEWVDLMMTEVRGASNAKAKRELGWTPTHPSWRTGF